MKYVTTFVFMAVFLCVLLVGAGCKKEPKPEENGEEPNGEEEVAPE